MQTFTLKHRGYKQDVVAASPFAYDLAARDLIANFDKVVDEFLTATPVAPVDRNGMSPVRAMHRIDDIVAEYGWVPA